MTPNKEDYLKCIHDLSENGRKMTNKEISEKMGVSAPAVSEMLKKMIVEGFIAKDKQLGYALTAAGQLLVSVIYRKHRLLEVFLTNHLAYSPNDIHEEAEILEHTVSDLFIDRLEKLLDFPKFCPHGGTIPQSGQLLEEQYRLRLDQLSEKGTYRLVRYQDNFQLLNYLERYHLELDTIFDFHHYDPFAKTYQITLKDGQEIQMTDIVAHQLFVEPV